MINLVIHERIDEIDRKAWNLLLSQDNPFVRYEFYRALELSQCVGSNRGWRPYYISAYDDEKLKAVAPVYLKTDSFGEFIFDWAWAHAYEQHRIAYYPKLTMASPFSPVSAPKLLGDSEVIKNYLAPKIWEFYQSFPVSGLHALFTQKSEEHYFRSLGMIERDSFQYHWKRGGCETFEAFLTTLKRSRRKTIKKERRKVQEQGIVVSRILGVDIQDSDIEYFYECYLRTIQKKYSNAYLNHEFFRELIRGLPENVILVVAEKSHKRVASALYLQSEEILYGRYWGCLESFDSLHFELCLYQGIELALDLGLDSFEAGAQGEHKRTRGFQPVVTKSFHHLKHSQFNSAVENFIESERDEVKMLFREFERLSPFKDSL